MATFTPNLNLEQQGSTERASLVVLNSNLGKLDTFAGTVNGKIGKLSTPPAYSADCNDIDETCVVYVTDAATNSPGPWNILTTTVFDTSNAIAQYAIDVTSGRLKTRVKSNGWGAWKEFVAKGEVANGCYADNESKTTYSMPLTDFTSGAYWMAQMYIQTGPGSCGVYIVFMDTSSNVEITKVAGNSAITFTGVRNGDYIVLTANDTVWGGVRATTMNSANPASNRGYVDVVVPNGTNAGIYSVGSLSSLGIPSSATILSAQCYNANASLCVVTGFAVYQNVVYVYVAQTVQVADGVVRITYQN